MCDGELSDPVDECERLVERVKVTAVPTLYRKTGRHCPSCKKMRTPLTPSALPGSGFDISIEMAAAYLKTMGMSNRNIQVAFAVMLGLKVSAGTILNMTGRVSKALEPKYEELVVEMREADALNCDETSWRIDGKSSWAWVFVSRDTAVFTIRMTRSASVSEEMLEGYKGIMSTDSYSAYNGSGGSHQKCYLHYQREIKETILYKNRGPEFAHFARTLLKILLDSHEAAERAGAGELKRLAARFRARLVGLISCEYSDPDCRRFVKRLKRELDRMFTFITTGIDYHNNTAEQAVRPIVLVRKTTGGSRSLGGARNFEILMSVREMCRLRGMDFYEYGIEYLGRKASKVICCAADGPAPRGGAGAPAGAKAAGAGKTASKP